jgi:Tc5 transposase DNA-binding domain
MPGRPKSDTRKRQIIREQEESFRIRAIAAYKDELLKPDTKRKGARTIVRDFINLYKLETGQDIKLTYHSLLRGANGGRTQAQANASRSWLTDEERDVVIKYIAECGDRGFPLSHRRLKEHVDEILRARLGEKFPTRGVGTKWTYRCKSV